MKQALLILCVLTFAWLESNGQTIMLPTPMTEDTLTWKATVVKISFINKRGTKIEGQADLFLQKDGKNYFIKLSGGKVLRSELEPYVGQEISVELIFRKGNWDTEDGNHMQQSRVGEYVLLYKILN